MFPCPICDVKLNSAEQRRAHCRGKNHIKREEARKKAEELGTDFDSTPDHCDVCNVPLTSKMTAIDHFKGKMHQKKVKAVADQRQGFKNYCDICEVPLQSLKVSEAHFNGKQHCKRQRKTNSAKGQGKKIPIERKSTHCRSSRPKPEAFSTSQNFFGVLADESSTISTSWENLNCDNEVEPKDLFSEFRNSLSGKATSSPDTPNSSSPESLKEPFFSFDCPVVSNTSTLILPNPTTNDTPLNKVRETTIPRNSAIQQTPVLPTTLASNGVNSFFKAHDSRNAKLVENTAVVGLWQENCKFSNETCNTTVPFPSPESLSKGQNGVTAQSDHIMHTQAVVRVLREAGKGISSGDIAMKIAGLSPSDVNLILNDLEQHHLVSKSGYAPILWSLFGANVRSIKKQPHETLNGFSHPERIPLASPKEPELFETAKGPYFNQNINGQSHFITTEAYTAVTAAAMLASRSLSTTTTSATSETLVHVIETNLVNLFQQNATLTVHEMKAKLDFRDDATLHFILHKLVERNVLVKEGETPPRWRRASLSRSNVGVIGEERKRRSPVQSEATSCRERTPTPPKENGVPNGYHVPTCESNTFLHHQKNGLIEPEQHNSFWQELNNISPKYKFDHDINDRHVKHNRFSPPLPLKTETSEVLEDLTVTTPKPYQRELYEVAMQEDTVCYLPCGTGKDLVMAQVIAHMAVLNPTKQALVVVQDIVTALNVAQYLRKELGSRNKRMNLNVALHAGQLKQSSGKVQVVVVTSSTCLVLLNCGALSWKHVCLLIFDQATMCCNDDASKKILHEYYLKAKMEFGDGQIPKLLSFIDSSAGEKNVEETVRAFGNVSATMGDVFLSCVSECTDDLDEAKREAMFVCVQAGLSEEEARMFFLLGTYLNLVFDNLAAQWQPLNSYRELLKISFKESSVISEAFVKLIALTGQPLEKRLPASCLKTWRHYLAICEVIFALVECGEDIANEVLVNLTHEEFGFSWANDVGLPGFELSKQLMENEIPNWGTRFSNPRGSGVRELLEQLMIMQWENARVSSERPLAIIIVKLNKTAKVLASYLSRCSELVKRNVKTTFLDGSRFRQQKAVISAIKRRQYQVIVSTDSLEDNYELPHCELVVLLDEPTSVYALEQLRTRRATNVVAICRDPGGEEKLKELLRREGLVEKAITIIRGCTN